MQDQKIFCVGFGKTGTTSLESFFKELNISVGDQVAGELLLHDWAARNFSPVIDLASTAQFFQDMPFSCPFTFQVLDVQFPTSKFILSIRSDSDQWYRSLTRFHTKLIGKGRLPTADDLREYDYRYKGWLLEAVKLVYGVTEAALYDRDTLIEAYENHNKNVIQYFRHKDNLLVVDVSWPDSAKRVIDFVGLNYNGEQMPKLNSSD